MQTPPHSCELYSVFINGRKEPKAWVGVQITRLQLPHLTRHDTHTHKTKLSFPFFPLASVPLGGGAGILTPTNGGRIFCWFRPWLQSFSSNPRPSPKTSEIKPGKNDFAFTFGPCRVWIQESFRPSSSSPPAFAAVTTDPTVRINPHWEGKRTKCKTDALGTRHHNIALLIA